MNLILFPDYVTALAADQRAFAYLKTDSNAQGASWSGVYTDGTRYGILFDSCIVSAFTSEESANIVNGTDWNLYTPPTLSV